MKNEYDWVPFLSSHIYMRMGGELLITKSAPNLQAQSSFPMLLLLLSVIAAALSIFICFVNVNSA